eukprot:TRINITY_DN11120_c0_g1_i1.p1 TRINITY_DN11120_c0_g1~~TRINITY_DN11120_c0_g1_i1.p1  ORF type:complete len:145 (-),score=16.17 TRINITY_DN11120_c0_g1_i1:79-513(-)
MIFVSSLNHVLLCTVGRKRLKRAATLHATANDTMTPEDKIGGATMPSAHMFGSSAFAVQPEKKSARGNTITSVKTFEWELDGDIDNLEMSSAPAIIPVVSYRSHSDGEIDLDTGDIGDDVERSNTRPRRITKYNAGHVLCLPRI